MKNTWTCLILAVTFLKGADNNHLQIAKLPKTISAPNIFIITVDGFRWQELFDGADSSLINAAEFTPDAETMTALYWDASDVERRKKLLPFFWNVIAAKGQLYGNRAFDNKVNTANAYSISYPGYNEIFTGQTDPDIASNEKLKNQNINVLEFLNAKPAYKGKVAVFTSWDVFPYILNEQRSGMIVNSGYETMDKSVATPAQAVINKVQEQSINEKKQTRYDELTFATAKEYILQNHPRVVYLSFGETDEFAHQRRYDLYLQQANKIDKLIAELWHLVQTTAFYKDNSIFIITTDHGRGSKKKMWTSHGEFIRGSSQTWLAVMGPGIAASGEIKGKQQLYQQQIAQTIAALAGENFSVHKTAPAITLK